MSSGGEIERCREVVKERRSPAVFGAAWHGRGVNGWADADLLTSLLQIVTIGQAFKCTYRELPGRFVHSDCQLLGPDTLDLLVH